MDINGIRTRVAKIANYGYDPEATHFMEDNLYEDVLEAIASGAENAAALAVEALKVRELDLVRWYA